MTWATVAAERPTVVAVMVTVVAATVAVVAVMATAVAKESEAAWARVMVAHNRSPLRS